MVIGLSMFFVCLFGWLVFLFLFLFLAEYGFLRLWIRKRVERFNGALLIILRGAEKTGVQRAKQII